MGVEPTSEAWEASILPMNYSRMEITLLSVTYPLAKIKRKFGEETALSVFFAAYFYGNLCAEIRPFCF